MKLKEQFGHPLLVGALSYVGSKMLDQGFVKFGETPIDLAIFNGLVAAGGSFAGETLKHWVLPYIPHNNASMVKVENALLHPALTAGVSLLAIRGVSNVWEPKMALIAGSAELVGTYAWDNIVSVYV